MSVAARFVNECIFFTQILRRTFHPRASRPADVDATRVHTARSRESLKKNSSAVLRAYKGPGARRRRRRRRARARRVEDDASTAASKTDDIETRRRVDDVRDDETDGRTGGFGEGNSSRRRAAAE